MRFFCLLACLLALGCEPGVRNQFSNVHPDVIRSGPNGVRYAIVTIEGQRFIGTQDGKGIWYFAGPLREPEKEDSRR